MTNTAQKAHSANETGVLRMGLPMWFLPQWKGQLLSADQSSASALAEYSQVFRSIEGNTTFYGLPEAARLRQWLDLTTEDFRFCFKLPRAISHATDIQAALRGLPGRDLAAFLEVILAHAPDKLGVLMLQLPGRLGADRAGAVLEALDYLLGGHFSGGQGSGLALDIAVECRHPSFFDKTHHEPRWLRALADRQIDRVVFDTRGLMADKGSSAALLDAQRKKPAMPVHPIATGRCPVVRFIGHPRYEDNQRYFQQWHKKLSQWQQQGKSPYVFWHTVGNHDVPQLHRRLLQEYWQQPVVWPGESGIHQTADLWG
ncbi:DUF72 domain-containing protein [Oceanobacter sp. 5_MG-2023]|uniref:DUF72 domain-containing protein n=1 Tax=Oceanobacter sp. 5_MG-2023 TaxID=3062645 RepID=UPI0026E16AEB|nr:DUF72 domain-containing protein [Oceanobacter sp. 5_MG-2023]MDO6681016.1 DUF72 domain-containing protein [Oceanobacter sp. 5_MG-2023]